MNHSLDNLKKMFKAETGFDISQYDAVDKGELTSRQNGYVGGYIGGSMTKKLVDMAEQEMGVGQGAKKQ
jgi:hypothetical protein